MSLPEPAIQTFQGITLCGHCVNTNLVSDQTRALWQGFQKQKNALQIPQPDQLFSVRVYPDDNYFRCVQPQVFFDKWAAMPLSVTGVCPEGMQVLEIPSGLYAVFLYRGKPSEAAPFFISIFKDWLPASPYLPDLRPHFEILDSKYLGEHPDSEELVCVPVKLKHSESV